MAELTIQISDELASRLEPLRERLPQLLAQLLETTDRSAEVTVTDTSSVYAEVLDFLLHSPTKSEIIAFKVSPQAQERLRTLLEKNRESALTPLETAELDTYQQLEHLMILLKAHAVNAIN
ncbi:hypothetical protein [Gloeothece verrucosa]|uniref:Uncharacterized protein n=1 Tax=Gloeothece verrucosa (strain PCC 7822) TaxID=497965 RepID=E0UNW1_GLOV7|nr:hypothetical protein [Gloeothece verrucosa]ADN18641.1 conserved hypothetical protein [Gloeothece verrucosa PCC 7822]